MRLGEKVSEDLYRIKLDPEGEKIVDRVLSQIQGNGNTSSDGESSHRKKIKSSTEDVEHFKAESKGDAETNALSEPSNSPMSSESLTNTLSTASASPDFSSHHITDVRSSNEQ